MVAAFMELKSRLRVTLAHYPWVVALWFVDETL